MITTAFLKKNELNIIIPPFIEDIFNIERDLVGRQVKKIIDILSDNIVCLIEYPYVDKFHRDSYYAYFSRKHNAVNRNSVRISFFDGSLDTENYLDYSSIEIEKKFFGFITIRPTTYRIIGHSFISPKALINHNFVCCLNKKTVLIYGKKLSVYGFPFCSQDNESITCSEAALINLMDYFGHKYPEYSTILPSQVNKILSKQSYQRQLPSNGLPTESISYVLKKLGFGSIVYSYHKKDKEFNLYTQEEFKELLYIYIESGIPIIATLSTEKNGHHAVLVIGRESIDEKIRIDSKFQMFGTNRTHYFSDIFNKVLIMNDNHTPYEMVNFKEPIYDSSTDSKYHFRSFIVPLYTKVYLDAFQFKKLFFIIIEKFEGFSETQHIKFTNKNKEYIYRFFLTSSKTYKHYLANSTGLSHDFKVILINKSMPKFIWVGEIIEGNQSLLEQRVESIVVLDATESGYLGHLIFATNSTHLITKNYNSTEIKSVSAEIQYKIFKFDVKNIFYTFANNLKGEHTKWQN